jgi:sulfatase maturation enzyme AslB (radical SAM superfamily)
LQCPGCYAYGDQHLGGDITLREVRDYKGQALVDGILGLIDQHRPIHVSLVGGEPLVRFRELNTLLPIMAERGIYTQVVTSAVREIPAEWRGLDRLQIVVSIDGLQPEHDVRRAPATYERILKHIVGHKIIVHCTVTKQQARRQGYLEEFVRFWSERTEIERIWMSLYTPQVGEESDERLDGRTREQVLADLWKLSKQYEKLQLPMAALEVYANPPASPEESIFAQCTTTVSANLETPITPCQFGGDPDCSSCGCLASAGLGAVARHRLLGVIPVGAVFNASLRIGDQVRAWRH